ncbi:MAG: ATP-binding protein [Planctomycetes bacterium]|nr:ATP-binding protein [Planctomycetota bacterium]
MSDERRPAFADRNRQVKYSEATKEFVLKLLAEIELPRDALPYTEPFDKLKADFERRQNVSLDNVDFWRMLSSVGKGGGLAPGGRKKRAPRTPTLTDDEQLEILRLMPDGIGNRDHLPYTAEFDEMHRRFTQLTGKKLTKHEFWRGVSRVAKLSRKPKPVLEASPVGGLSDELVAFLERNNPWWRGQPSRASASYRRWAYAELVDRLSSKLAKVVVIRGPRRVGKSVIQTQLVEELLLLGRIDPKRKPVNPGRILYVQFDEAPALGGMTSPIETVVGWYETNVLKMTLNAAAKRGEPAYLLFDEVQNLPNWSAQLKVLVDHSDLNIVVTGSSALRIGAGQDNLAGRMTTIELGPLRLTEVAGIRRLRELPAYAPDGSLEAWKEKDFWLGLIAHGKKHAKVRDEAFKHFSALGGYPLCHTTFERDTSKIRQQVIDEVITKTIEFDPLHRTRAQTLDSQFIREVLRIACRYAGQAPRPRIFADETRAVLQTGVNETRVNEALDFLADSLLLYRVPPLEMLAKRQGQPAKLCLCDHFVRDGVLQETLPLDPDALRNCDQAVATQVGHVLESVLGYYLHGIPGAELSWFPSRDNEPEVDLVLTIGTQRIPLEVKYQRGGVAESDAAGVRSFCGRAAYAAPFGLIVTQSAEGPVGGYAIAIPASTFLLIR